ncbi:DUF4144 domain-containing protein [Shewanella gaetbuli]|uniref:DUF4144 domain-containing protein n=1 Tax=Shewanella gaetbuli TaxID=220752 RepID=A0A9X2CHN9_9GAMM|nr:DUF4144 domain-containing protein [Shewanella gaetbuli]MCL1142217.1 DUF4144 domain-containing protein [Shewanella gaetbuli]
MTLKLYWPAIIQQNDGHLLFIADNDHLQDYLTLDAHFALPEDKLIDSQGQTILVSQLHRPPLTSISASIAPPKINKTSLNEFIAIIRLYAQQQNQCCTSKITFTNFSQGMQIIQQLD